MDFPHPIRLRGPWRYEVPETSDRGKCVVPDHWGPALGEDFTGPVRFSRGFSSPTSLGEEERVWLIVEGVDPCGEIALNGRRLGRVDGYALPAAFEITSLLAPRNQLQIDVASLDRPDATRPGREDRPGGVTGEVRLEVRARQCLADAWLEAPQDDEMSLGAVPVGEATAEPLQALVLVGGDEVQRRPVVLNEEFCVVAPSRDIPVWRPGADNRLTEVELLLLRGGRVVWESAFATAVQTAEVLDCAGNVPQQAEILPEKDYAGLDQTGRGVVQSVPSEWARRVGRRLAHHPSILGWTTSESAAAPPGDTGRLYGRQWVGVER